MGRLTIAEGKSLTSVARLYVWTIPVSSSGRFIRDIIHITALDLHSTTMINSQVSWPQGRQASPYSCASALDILYLLADGSRLNWLLPGWMMSYSVQLAVHRHLTNINTKCAPVEFRGGMITYCRFVLALCWFVLFPVRIPIIAFFFFFLNK